MDVQDYIKVYEDIVDNSLSNDLMKFNHDFKPSSFSSHEKIHEDSKNLKDIGKATWYIGNSWTQNHHVLYTANCWDYEIETNCTIDDYISSYDFNDEVLKICNEVWEVWEKINGQ